MATRAKKLSTTAMAIFCLALMTLLLGAPASTVKAQAPAPTPAPATQTTVLTVKRGGYSNPCWDNILLGLKRLGNGDNFVEISPSDYVDYNVRIGSMETTAGFISIDGTPAGCLCDLASWIGQSATNSGAIRPEADTWVHKAYDIPYSDRDITIWHVDQDASCFTNGKRNGTCAKPALEQDLLLYNDSTTDTVRLGWTADETQIVFWVESFSSQTTVSPTTQQVKDQTIKACGKPFDLADGQWIERNQLHTGCDASSPCDQILGDDFWPAPGLDPAGKATHPTSKEFPVKLISTINGNVTWASTTAWNDQKGKYECTSSCDGVGNSIVTLDNDFLTVYYMHLDQVFVKVGDQIKVGDSIGIMGDVGLSDWTHLHYAIHIKATGKNVTDLAGTFSCSPDISSQPGSPGTTQQSQPSVSEQQAAPPVTNVADLPFVEDKTTSQQVADSSKSTVNENPGGIVWQAKAAPQAQPDTAATTTSSDTNITVTDQTITVNNQDWAVAQSTNVVPNADGNIIITFVDTNNDGLPTPEQEKTLQALTRVLMDKYHMSSSQVSAKGPINMDQERKALEAVQGPPTVGSILTTVFPYMIAHPEKQTFLNLDWTSSVQITGEQTIRLVIAISGGLLLLLLLSHALNNYFQDKKRDGDGTPKRKKKGGTTITADELRELEKHRKLIKRTRLITKLDVFLITSASVIFIVGMVVYTPVAYRSEAIIGVRTAKASDKPVQQPTTTTATVASISANPSDALWQQIATEAGYSNWQLLQSACTTHNVARGPDGKPLSQNDGGKIFPCWWVAAVPSVESNDANWNGVDPRKPGPWGYELGWTACPDWFKLTPADVLAGKTINDTAQACRDGLTAIANNAVVQQKWPGITPQQIYSSGAGAVGRGQTESFYFRPGAMLGDLENMDVWSTEDVAVEAIVRHLVSRYNTSTCGANQNWYYTQNVEEARCAYNPGAWGDSSVSWYWDGMRDHATKIQTALQAHESELAGLPVIEVQTTKQSVAQVVQEQQPAQQTVPIVQSGGNRPTIGSGAYTIYDTLPSLALQLVKAADDGKDPKYKMWERWIFNFGRFFYTSEDVRVNLGFDKLP